MIKILARGIASILLEVATALLVIALTLGVLSAYITARIVGANLPTAGRIGMATKLSRDLLAVAIDWRRKQTADTPVEDNLAV